MASPLMVFPGQTTGRVRENFFHGIVFYLVLVMHSMAYAYYCVKIIIVYVAIIVL